MEKVKRGEGRKAGERRKMYSSIIIIIIIMKLKLNIEVNKVTESGFKF